MNEFNQATYTSLLDLLASHTSRYTQMLADNIKTEEFYKCKRVIEQITAELESRKKAGLSNEPTNLSINNASLLNEQ